MNHSGVSIVWFVNGTASNDETIIQLGIVTSGAGSQQSNLTIPGYPQYNNTIVKCNAFGVVNDTNYINTSKTTLSIQGIYEIKLSDSSFPSGKLSEVVELTCTSQGHCCINCSWFPPFSLNGVPIYGYIINVTNEGDNTQYTTTTNTTSWIYCPSQFGKYTFSIAGNNSAGEGKTTNQNATLLGIY